VTALFQGKDFMHTRRLVSALAIAAAAGLAAPAAAASFVQTYGIAVTDTGAPSTFGFTFGMPVSFSGQIALSLSIGGALADGARDGAALTPTGGTLGFASLNGQSVASAGTAWSFAGAGGTAGIVQVGAFTVSDPGTPTPFAFSFQQPVPSTVQRTASQGGAAGAVLDGGTDGGALTGTLPGGNIGGFSALSGATAVPGAYGVGAAPVAAGTTFAATGAGVMQCSGADVCDAIRSEAAFQLSGGNDVAAAALRQEFGGDEIAGTVIDAFGIELGNGVFDCDAVGGCTFLTFDLSFLLSGGGDAAALVARIQIDQLDEVPEPAALALFGGTLAALALARRRRRAPRG
jgi:hypothetical protein